ncbi:hypothetical protein [Gimesia alba]|nr:hypothetical protein [Gimesia alba]
MNAIQREMHSARSTAKPRVLSQQTEKQPSQIQQVGLTLKPRGFFQKKKSSKSKTQTKKPEEKRPVIVRGGNQTAGPQYQTAVPQPNAKPGQSEIQRQLEALYRRDGRQMPPMRLDALPKTANSGSAAGRGVVNPPPATQAAPVQQNVAGAAQQHLIPKMEEKKKWYEKFLPAKTKQTPKRLPQSHQVVKKAPVNTPVMEKTIAPAQPQLPAAPAPAQPSIVAGPQTPVENTESIAKTPMPATEELDDEELKELEEEAAERLEEQRIAAAKESAAETPLIEEKTVEVAQEKIIISPEDDFKNLFPEMSEEEADGLKKPKVAQEAPAKESTKSTPFSGLVLEEDGLKKSAEKPTVPAKEETPQVAQETPKKEVNPFEPQPAAEATPEKEVNPFEVPAPKVAEKEMEKPEDNPFKPQPERKLDAPPVQPKKQIATTEPDSSIEKKLALIASRGNIKGLKGFCPVALRDNRLLVDARPEFSSSYKSMNYQFASLENKLKFDREPAKYAPAAGGSDLVLLVDHQDDKEGTLDYASWYKGRLYLFSNQTNMNIFMKTPALYVGVE